MMYLSECVSDNAFTVLMQEAMRWYSDIQLQ